jgi:hypothetical protein
VLSDLLWAGFGINRPSGERTAPYWRHVMVIDAAGAGMPRSKAVTAASLLDKRKVSPTREAQEAAGVEAYRQHVRGGRPGGSYNIVSNLPTRA